MRKIIAKIRVKTTNKFLNIKNKLRNNTKMFRKRVSEEKKRPKSKLKSYLFGFGTALSILGITFFTKSLPANANDAPVPAPDQISPAPAKSSDEIVATLTGVATSLCATPVSSGSFLVGIAYGVVVDIDILKAQRK